MTSDDYTNQSEATEAYTPADAVPPIADARQPEPREEAARTVRFLWPTLASLWQAGER